MSPDLILKVMGEGMSFVCSHCDKFWWSYQRGLSTCKADQDGLECSSPFNNMAFPEYKGVLKNSLHKYCFVCGQPPTKVVKIKVGKMVYNIGICEKHSKLINNVKLVKND